MFSVDEALAHILPAFRQLPPESIALSEALGRTLAADVKAAFSIPPFPNSSMDGYALRAEDTASATPDQPVRLAVIGDIPAGQAPRMTVGSGQAVRIMTGAAMPAGADAVIPLEMTSTPPTSAPMPLPLEVDVQKALRAGDYVRVVGEDMAEGATVLRAGRKLRPADLGALAALGIGRVSVIRRPVVAIFSTGDELTAPGEALQPGKIYDTNSYTISAMVTEAGGKPVVLGILPDKAEAVEAAFKTATQLPADLVLTTAGVSVGAFDVVKTAVTTQGTLNFWKVNMRPGKPLAFGQIEGRPFFGLPGNPVSSLVSFEVFIRPALLKMQGRPWDVPLWPARVGEDMSSDGRESYIRVVLQREEGALAAYSTGTQSSGALSSLVRADALLIIPAGVKSVRAGEMLFVRPFAGQSLDEIGRNVMLG